MNVQRCFSLLLVGALLGLGAGCRSYSERLTDYRRAYAMGDTQTATREIKELVLSDADTDSARDALPILLEAGSALRTAGQIRESAACFARAERIYEHRQQQAKISVSKETMALLTNPAKLPYRGSGVDILMLHVYQALNTLQLGDIDGARQPLVRMDLHQKAVVSENAKRIAKDREAVKASENQREIALAESSDRTKDNTQLLTKDLPDTRGYELYVNPFAEYLYAFYHLYAGRDEADREMARFRMQRALAMAPNNTAIRLAAERLEAGAPVPSGVYLFHEDGMAVYREAIDLFFPIFAADTISLMGLALPKLVEDNNRAGFATLVGGGQAARAELVGDVDAMMTQEYKNDLPGILTRAIASATAKAVAAYAANYAAQQSGNSLAVLGAFVSTTVYQVASNVADTRSWNSLPKQIGVSRIDLPANRTVDVVVNGQTISTHQLPTEGDVWVIHLRTMHYGSRPSVQLFRIR